MTEAEKQIDRALKDFWDKKQRNYDLVIDLVSASPGIGQFVKKTRK